MHRLQALLVLSLAPVLAVLAPSPLTAAPAGGVTAPLVAAVGLLAWAGSGWLLLVVAVTFGARLPGSLGRVAHRISLYVAPASVRRLVRVALGAGIAASVLAGGSVAYGDSTPRPAAAASSFEWPGVNAVETPVPVPADLDWPGASPSARPATPRPAATTPPVATSPTSPTSPPRHSAPAPVSTPVVGPLARPAVTGPVVVGPRVPAAVLVRAGDSLWEIAARDLGPGASAAQVAQAWPRWWAANRVLLGDDPGLIHPGDQLAPPTA
jgi:hypothetical protein